MFLPNYAVLPYDKENTNAAQGSICTLMREPGLYDLMPALCRLDYSTSEAGGASRFVREYTLASGGSYCDCGYHKR